MGTKKLFSMLTLMGFVVSLGFSTPARSAPDAALFGQLPQAHDAAISPNGKDIAVLRNQDGNYLIQFVHLGKQKIEPPLVVSFGKDVQPNYLKWIDDDRVIVSVSQTEMFRNAPLSSGYLHLIHARTGKTKIVIKPPKNGLRQFNNRVLDWLEDDPDHIIMQFAEDGRDQNLPAVQKVRVDTGRAKTIRRPSPGVNDWITDSDGIPRVGLGFRNRGKDFFMRIQDPVSEDWLTVDHFPGINPETDYIVAVTHEGRSLVLSAYRGQDTRGLHRYDLVNKTWAETLYQNDTYDVGNVILSKDGNEIVGASFTGESEERVLFDEYNSTFEEALDTFKDFQVGFIDQTEDGSTLLMWVSGPSEPGGLYFYQRGRRASELISRLKGLENEPMGAVSAIRYTARDGAKIPAFITLPPSITDPAQLKSVPSIILPHGGPYSRDSKSFDWLAQFFATRGYLVLQMNFRGSSGYGRSFADAGRNSWVMMQEDVEDGMQWLIKKGYADPEKTCIAGWSYGGYAALMGAIKTPDLYQCSIAIAALADIPMAISDASSYHNGRARAKRTFGALMDDKDLMKANNPVGHADKITVPVFLAHGDQDEAVQFGQFRKMKSRLERADVDGTYMSFEDEDHYMSNQANRQAMLEGIEAFLLKVNGESPFILK